MEYSMALPSSFLRRSLLTAISATLVATTAQAGSFNNARSLAMGGTGVATAHPAAAASLNPAMMAATHHEWSDDFGLILPSVNVRFADEEEVLDQVDDLQDAIDNFDELAQEIKNFESFNLTEAERLRDEARLAAGDLLEQLEAFDKDTIRINAGVGLSLAVPSPRLAVGFFTNGSLNATVRGEFDEDDAALLRKIAEDTTFEPEDANLEDELKSRGRILASAVVEAGISFAHALDLGNDHVVQLGVSPKYVQLRTFQYTASIAEFEDDDFDGAEYETEKSGFNLDLGAAYAFGENKQWNTGLVVKNLIPMELKSAQSRPDLDEERYTLELKPKVTAAIAHTGNYHVVTAELELTKQKGFGYADDTQWFSVGAEFDAWRFAQLRVGARHNLASNEDNAGIEEKTQFTAGIGLNPFGARLDIAALVSDSDLGAAIELGAAF